MVKQCKMIGGCLKGKRTDVSGPLNQTKKYSYCVCQAAESMNTTKTLGYANCCLTFCFSNIFKLAMWMVILDYIFPIPEYLIFFPFLSFNGDRWKIEI